MKRTQRVLLWAAVVVLAVIAFAALWPGVLATDDPLQTDVRAALLPPSTEHLFGTDQSGRDVYSRVIHGAGRSLGIGLLATGVALAVGLVIGAAVMVLFMYAGTRMQREEQRRRTEAEGEADRVAEADGEPDQPSAGSGDAGG